jgi:hypothetical protein
MQHAPGYIRDTSFERRRIAVVLVPSREVVVRYQEEQGNLTVRRCATRFGSVKQNDALQKMDASLMCDGLRSTDDALSNLLLPGIAPS